MSKVYICQDVEDGSIDFVSSSLELAEIQFLERKLSSRWHEIREWEMD